MNNAQWSTYTKKTNYDASLHNHLVSSVLKENMCYMLRNLLRYLLRIFLLHFSIIK